MHRLPPPLPRSNRWVFSWGYKGFPCDFGVGGCEGYALPCQIASATSGRLGGGWPVLILAALAI